MLSISKTISLTSALCVSFLLFISIPFMRNLLGMQKPEARALRENRRIIAEIVRQVPQKKQPEIQTMRQVKTAAGSHGNALPDQNGVAFKFTPDLGVEGSAGVAVAMHGQDLEAMVFEENQVDEDIVPVYTPAISYPERAKDQGAQGTLEAVIIIGRDGKVEKVDIVRSPHESISQEAKRVLMSWRFKPGKNKGVPVKVRAKQVVDFNLE